MKSEIIINVKEREIKKTRTKKLLFFSGIFIVLSIVILNLISFLIT